MIDAHALMLLFDQAQEYAVENRLMLISHEFPDRAITTETVVLARDPLKVIADDLDALKIVPTMPTSDQFMAIAGHFYSRGVLYRFSGATSGHITMPITVAQTLLVGYKINRLLRTVELYHTTVYGTLPEFHPDVMPAAVIRLRAGATEIRSEDILSILPLYDYDTSHPGDRTFSIIPCLLPRASTMIDHRPFYHDSPPILDIWQMYPQGTVQYVMQSFEKQSDLLDIIDPTDPKAVYDPELYGVTLRAEIIRDPIDLPGDASIIFVDPQYGQDINPGTKSQPVASIRIAVAIFNAMPEKTTIFLNPGIYQQNYDRLVFTRDIEIVGYSLSADVRFSIQGRAWSFMGNVRMRNLLLHNIAVPPSSDGTAIIMAGTNRIDMLNCVIRYWEGTERIPLLDLENLFMTNCVCHNPDDHFQARLYPTQPTGFLGQQNLVIIGNWSSPFQWDPSNYTTTNAAAYTALVDPQRYDYLPVKDGPLAGEGTYATVGANVDGSAPDIGVYGGQYASEFPIKGYPVNQPAIFKYSLSSMFSPVMDHITDIETSVGIPTGTQIYGAVSFNGGGTWLAWDQYTAAWVEIPIGEIHQRGNTYDDLVQRIIAMGQIIPKGEIVYAWALTTTTKDETPVMRYVKTSYETKVDSYVPFDRSKVQIMVNEFSILIQNVSDTEKILNLAIVAY